MWLKNECIKLFKSIFIIRPLHDIFLSLGSNQGDSHGHLQAAVNLLFNRLGNVIQLSPLYKTASWGYDGADFLNAVVYLKTQCTSHEVITEILKIERELGRKRNLKKMPTQPYEDRIIDIDLLFYDDEICESKQLSLPHPELHHRNFVLLPLADIAPEMMHPRLHKSILCLLQESQDRSIAQPLRIELKNPNEKYGLYQHQYIAIEGNIGAGKTTLATMIARDFNAKLILERFKDNPFLPQFYKDKERYAFPLEMSFLADRYQQLLDDLGQHDLFKDFVISDYDSYKSLIFAKVTLNEDEFKLYKKLHGIMYGTMVKPMMYIYLYQNTERLLQNIKKRGRDYEQGITQEYLAQINAGYLEFIRTKQGKAVKIIDISELDFVDDRADYLKILSQIAG